MTESKSKEPKIKNDIECDDEKKESNFWIYAVLIVLILGIIGVWLYTPIYVHNKFPLDEGLASGTFGDLYGSINSLFSGLAFAGLIFTIILQGKELRLQRHELKAQRRATEGSTKEQEEHTQLMHDQLELDLNKLNQDVKKFNHLKLKEGIQSELKDFEFQVEAIDAHIKHCEFKLELLSKSQYIRQIVKQSTDEIYQDLMKAFVHRKQLEEQYFIKNKELMVLYNK